MSRVPQPRRPPEVHVFVIWSQARSQERRILADLADRFAVVEVVEVRWTQGELFARNLTRMYGDALPQGSDKEQHCGSGPFLVVVVEDDHPRYGWRPTSRGRRWLNTGVFDARQRYRDWTGGGYRVHASDSETETERNLALLLGESPAAVRARRPADRPRAEELLAAARSHDADVAGTDGWSSVEQLRLALHSVGAHVFATGPDRLRVLATDLWWAEHVAGGVERRPGVRTVQVAGAPVELVLEEDDRAWPRRLRALRSRFVAG